MARRTRIATAALVIALFVEANYGGLCSDAVFFQESTLYGANPMFSPLYICCFQQNLIVCQVKVTVKQRDTKPL